MANYDKLTAKLLFGMFCAFGGIYKSNKIPKWMKYAWSAYHFIGVLFFCISPTFYYIFIHIEREIDLDDRIAGGMTAALMFYVVIGIPLISVYYYDELYTVLQYLMDYETFKPAFQSEAFVIMTEKSELNVVRSALRKSYPPIFDNVFIKRENPLLVPGLMFISGTIFGLLMTFTPLFYILFITDLKAPNLLQYYPLPFCFYDRVSSRRVYYCIYFLLIIFLMGPHETAVAIGVFFLTFAFLMNNIVVDYVGNIQHLSIVATQFLEGNEESERVNQFIYYFEKDLKTLIEKYKELTQIVEKLQPFLNLYSTFTVMAMGVTQFCNIYGLLAVKDSRLDFKVVRHLMALLPCTLCLWNACQAGKKFLEMGEAIRYEVYNLPWYHMPPKTRKVINIYQAMVLHPWDFKVFEVYPADMALFPRVMNIAYSYVNIMRTAKAKFRD